MQEPDTIDGPCQITGPTAHVNGVMLDGVAPVIMGTQFLGVVQEQAGTRVGRVKNGQMFEDTDNTLGLPRLILVMVTKLTKAVYNDKGGLA